MVSNQLSAFMRQLQQQMQNQMNNFQEDTFEAWKNVWELAAIGDTAAAQQIKSHTKEGITNDNPILNCNFVTLLLQSKIHELQPNRTLGPFQLYSHVPSYLLLEGNIRIQCINLEGDDQTVTQCKRPGLVQLDQLQLKAKFGETNITLITQFEIVGVEKAVLIEIEPSSLALCGKVPNESTVTLREEVIMKRYMIIALKHITKLKYTKGTPLKDKFYLLEGRACYYQPKTKTILSCYEEGIFSPEDLTHPQLRLYLFEGAYLLIFESQMLKDEVVFGTELKRKQHLEQISLKYSKLLPEQKPKLQQKLMEKYDLNRQQVEKQIWVVPKAVPVDKRVKSKNDLINTSSSMKEKCGIRIRKSKKIT